MNTKFCNKCKEIKPIASFGKRKVSKKNPSGYDSRCKKCCAEAAKEYRKRKKLGLVGIIEKLPDGQKRCTKCNVIKLFTDFTKDKSRKDGLFPWCFQCSSEDHKQRRDTIRKTKGLQKRVTQKWDKVSEKILKRENKKGKTDEEIQKEYFPNRSLTSISAKRLRLGLSSPLTWKKEDDDLLKTVYSKTTDYNLIQSYFANKSIMSLKARCFRLKLTNNKSPLWSKEEDVIVEQQIKAGKKIGDFCTLLPQRTESAINGRIQVLGLKAINIRKEINAERISKLTKQECAECKIEKKIDAYYKTQSGYMLICKTCRHNRYEEYRESYKPTLSKIQKANRLAVRKESAEKLNEYYFNHEVPKYLWHRDEFPTEEDFQKALEHTFVKNFKLEVEPWVYLEGIGYPDIYLKNLDFFIEVKLLSEQWSLQKIKEQVTKYQTISPVIIVSLDGQPEKWPHDICEWFTPDECFDFINELK